MRRSGLLEHTRERKREGGREGRKEGEKERAREREGEREMRNRPFQQVVRDRVGYWWWCGGVWW